MGEPQDLEQYAPAPQGIFEPPRISRGSSDRLLSYQQDKLFYSYQPSLYVDKGIRYFLG